MTAPPDQGRLERRLVAVLLVALGTAAVVWLVLVVRSSTGPDLPVADRLPELPESVVTVPVAYDADEIAAEIGRRTPARIGDLDLRLRYAGDPALSYSYEAVRGPVEVTASGDTLVLRSTVRYGGHAWYRTPGGPELSASCGVDGDRVSLGAAVEFSAILTVAPDWSPEARVEVTRVEPIGPEDRCVVGMFAFQADVTDTIIDEVRRALELDARAIEEAVAAVPLGRIVRDVWRSLGQPLPLAQGGWIVLSPAGLGLRAISPSSSGESIQGTVLLAARPRWTPREPEPLPATALPDAVPVAPTAIPSIELDALLPLELLASEIERLARGSSVSFAGRRFEIAQVDVRMGDAPGRIAAELRLGEAGGPAVTLEGAPYLDSEAGVVGLRGLALSFDGLGFWSRAVARVFRPILRSRVAKAAELPVGDLLDTAPGIGTSARIPLADGVELVGSFDDVEIIGMELSEEGLVVRVRALPRPMLTVRL